MKKKVCYVADDNSEHPTELACREHDARLVGCTFLCPACNGSGKQNGEPIYISLYDKEATARGGHFAGDVYKKTLVGHEQVPCVVCDGRGWTAMEQKAIIEEKIIGWRDSRDTPQVRT